MKSNKTSIQNIIAHITNIVFTTYIKFETQPLIKMHIAKLTSQLILLKPIHEF